MLPSELAPLTLIGSGGVFAVIWLVAMVRETPGVKKWMTRYIVLGVAAALNVPLVLGVFGWGAWTSAIVATVIAAVAAGASYTMSRKQA